MHGWNDFSSSFLIPNLVKKETGAGGACQFSSIAESLSSHSKFFPFGSKSQIRCIAAQGILSMSLDEFEAAMINYRLDKSTNRFQGGWNPFSVASRQELANQVLLCNLSGNDSYFWGDDTTLLAIARQLQIAIYVLEESKKKPAIVKFEPKEFKYVILLFFSPLSLHYQSVGVKRKRKSVQVQTCFLVSELPREFSFYLVPKSSEKKTINISKKEENQKISSLPKFCSLRHPNIKPQDLLSWCSCHHFY